MRVGRDRDRRPALEDDRGSEGCIVLGRRPEGKAKPRTEEAAATGAGPITRASVIEYLPSRRGFDETQFLVHVTGFFPGHARAMEDAPPRGTPLFPVANKPVPEVLDGDSRRQETAAILEFLHVGVTSGSRVSSAILVEQVPLRYRRVDLRRRNVRVPEHGLHRTQVSSSFKQVGRK